MKTKFNTDVFLSAVTFLLGLISSYAGSSNTPFRVQATSVGREPAMHCTLASTGTCRSGWWPSRGHGYMTP